MRIIEGWNKKEQKELKRWISNYSDYGTDRGIMTMIFHIVDSDQAFNNLYLKYLNCNTEEENQMAKDIIDYYNGTAEFPEKKYYVKLLPSSRGYLNKEKNSDGTLTLYSKIFTPGYQTEFTMQEIKEIDSRLVHFAVEVDDDPD